MRIICLLTYWIRVSGVGPWNVHFNNLPRWFYGRKNLRTTPHNYHPGHLVFIEQECLKLSPLSVEVTMWRKDVIGVISHLFLIFKPSKPILLIVSLCLYLCWNIQGTRRLLLSFLPPQRVGEPFHFRVLSPPHLVCFFQKGKFRCIWFFHHVFFLPLSPSLSFLPLVSSSLHEI